MLHGRFLCLVLTALLLAPVLVRGQHELFLSSGDMGVHKCEFQVCGAGFPRCAGCCSWSQTNATLGSVPIITLTCPARTGLPSINWNLCCVQGVVSGRRVRLYVFLTACIGPGVSTDGTGAPGGQQRSDSGSANSTANFYITGNTFMLLDGEPCTTTQLQQPLDTLVWAAGLLPGADSSSSSPSSSNSRRSDMQEAPGGSSVAKEQRRKLTASRREEDKGDGGSTSSAAAAHEPEAALLAEATRALVSGSQGVLTLR